MTLMGVVKGRVVGNTVVLEEPMPEGMEVEVREVGGEDSNADGWDLTDEGWAEMDESLAEADRGEGVDAFEFLEALKREDEGGRLSCG